MPPGFFDTLGSIFEAPFKAIGGVVGDVVNPVSKGISKVVAPVVKVGTKIATTGMNDVTSVYKTGYNDVTKAATGAEHAVPSVVAPLTTGVGSAVNSVGRGGSRLGSKYVKRTWSGRRRCW